MTNIGGNVEYSQETLKWEDNKWV